MTGPDAPTPSAAISNQPAAPSRVRRLAASAARRALTLHFWRVQSIALAAGGIASLSLIAARRLWPLPIDDAWLLAAPVGVAIITAAALAVSQRWSVERAARELDQRLGLRDALSSALALHTRAISASSHQPAAESAALARLAIADAEALAARVSVAAALPALPPRRWLGWFSGGVLTLAAAWFTSQHWQPAAPRVIVATPRQTQEARSVVEQAKDALAKAHAAGALQPDAAASAISDVEKELASGDLSPRDATRAAAERLQAAADQIEDRAEQTEQDANAVRDALRELRARADARESQASDASPLAKALQSGDATRAAAEIERLQQSLADLPPDERARVADELDALAEQLKSQQRKPEQSKSDQAQSDQAKSDQAQPKQSDAESPSPSTDAPASSTDPAAPSGTQPERDANDPGAALADTMKKAADEVRRTSPPSQPPPFAQQKSDQPQSAPPQPPAPESDAKPEQPAQPPKDSGAPREQAKPSPDAAPPKDPPAAPSQPSQSQPSQPGATQQPAPTTTPTPSAPTPPTPPAAQGQSQPNPQGQQQQTPNQQGTPQQGQQQGQQSGQQQGQQPAPQQGQQQGQQNQPGQQSAPQSESPAQPSSQSGGQPSPSSDAKPSSATDPNASTPGSKDAADSSAKPRDTGKPNSGPSDKPASDQNQPNTPASSSGAGVKSAPSASKPDAQPEAASKPQPNARGQGQSPDSSRPDGSTPNLEQLKQALQRARDANKNAAADRQQARALREQAQRALDAMSPQEREELQRLAQQLQRDAPGGSGSLPGAPGAAARPGDNPIAPQSDVDRLSQQAAASDQTVRVRGRDDGTSKRTLAEWLAKPRAPSDSSAPADLSAALRDAARGGENAVEQQAVPSRHADYLKRVFKRYRERAEPKSAPKSDPKSNQK